MTVLKTRACNHLTTPPAKREPRCLLRWYDRGQYGYVSYRFSPEPVGMRLCTIKRCIYSVIPYNHAVFAVCILSLGTRK